jgi:WD40 repeat protein
MGGRSNLAFRHRGLALSRSIGPLAVLPWVALLLALAAPAQAAFPGANGKIAFSEYVSGSGWQVETIDPLGSGRTVLFAGDDPAWSVDGKRLAFARGREVFTAKPDGSDLVQLTDSFCQGDVCSFAHSPSWSPESDRLTLASISCGRFCDANVSVIGADGSGEHGIAYQATGPAWSPDGSTIAFDDFSYGSRPKRLLAARTRT